MNPLVMLLDLWSNAFSILDGSQQVGPASGPPRPDAARFGADPTLMLLAAMTSCAAAVAACLLPADGSRRFAGPRQEPGDSTAELRELMIRTFVATAGSSLRYWRQLAELYARKASLLQSETRRAFGELPPSQAERVLLDELRGMFRELADVGLTEAARLGAELEQIGGAVLDAAGATAPSGPYQRRWRAKD